MLLLALLLFAGNSNASVTLVWDAPDDTTNIEGYKLYYGHESGSYTESIDVGSILQYQMLGMVWGEIYYFAVTSYGTCNEEYCESEFSNEVKWSFAPESASNAYLSWREVIMSFPVVAGVNGGGQSSASTSHPINLPANIVSGDLLIVLFGARSGLSDATFDGWGTRLESGGSAGSGWMIGYRIATGDSNDDLTLITTEGRTTAHLAYRITGHGSSVNPPEITSSSSSLDPPLLTPGGGEDDYLWIVLATWINENYLTAAPTNYTNLQQYQNNAGGNSRVGAAGAERELRASSEDPDVFTATGTLTYLRTYTLAIYPASSAPELAQSSFRFRNDDGSESDATWKAGQGININLLAEQKARIRIQLDSTGDIEAKQFQLEYRRKPFGGVFGDWTKVE